MRGETNIYINFTSPKVQAFADATDEEIAGMLEMHKKGKIYIPDIWTVGDMRNVQLSAMGTGGYVGETHKEQYVRYIIGGMDGVEGYTGYELSDGSGRSLITLDQENCLSETAPNIPIVGEIPSEYFVTSSTDSEYGYMNPTNTNAGGWKDSARRKWCNDTYYNALPATFRPLVKQVKVWTDNVGNGSNKEAAVTATDDYAFLHAEYEVFGAGTYANQYEQNKQQQLPYFKLSDSNMYKKPLKSSSDINGPYFARNPATNASYYFCGVRKDGTADFNNAISNYGIAPSLCL